jgi:hypothetical protein
VARGTILVRCFIMGGEAQAQVSSFGKMRRS